MKGEEYAVERQVVVVDLEIRDDAAGGLGAGAEALEHPRLPGVERGVHEVDHPDVDLVAEHPRQVEGIDALVRRGRARLPAQGRRIDADVAG